MNTVHQADATISEKYTTLFAALGGAALILGNDTLADAPGYGLLINRLERRYGQLRFLCDKLWRDIVTCRPLRSDDHEAIQAFFSSVEGYHSALVRDGRQDEFNTHKTMDVLLKKEGVVNTLDRTVSVHI